MEQEVDIGSMLSEKVVGSFAGTGALHRHPHHWHAENTTSGSRRVSQGGIRSKMATADYLKATASAADPYRKELCGKIGIL